MFDFFISHSSSDKEKIVNDFVKQLKQNGFSVWYDQEQINAGKNINAEINLGLNNAFCIIVILTEEFLKKNWTLFEVGKFSANSINRIIPIVYDLSADKINYFSQIIGNVNYIKSTDNVIEKLTISLEKIKKENEYLSSIDLLNKLQRKINKYENISADVLCLSLKEYLDLLDQYPQYAINAAKKCVINICNNLLNEQLSIDNINYDNIYKLSNYFSINTLEYIKFILSNNNPYLESENIIILINKALYNIANSYIDYKYAVVLSQKNIEIIEPDSFTYQDFIEMCLIDKLVMRNDLIASVDTCYNWYKYNKYTHIGIRDKYTKKLVGYFTLLPITNETYDKIMSGDFMDKDFDENDILQYEMETFYKLYIAAVAIHPDYQNTNAFSILYNGLISLISELAKKRNIYFYQIIAEVSTKQGEKLCKLIGMKKVISTIENTDVYILTLIPPTHILMNRRNKELFNLLNEKYLEYKDYFDNIKQ